MVITIRSSRRWIYSEQSRRCEKNTCCKDNDRGAFQKGWGKRALGIMHAEFLDYILLDLEVGNAAAAAAAAAPDWQSERPLLGIGAVFRICGSPS
jgi:hypothetical protein